MQNVTVSGASVLSKWLVKYDLFDMPQFVQGIAVGDSNEYKDGQLISIPDVYSIDFQNKILKTNSGMEFFLFGKGKRLLMVDEDCL